MASEEPVIFLDIDGVLNNPATQQRSRRHERVFSADAVVALRNILEQTGARIVISSSWREDETRDEIVPAFEKNGLGDFTGRIMGSTPIMKELAEEVRRPEEIEEWIDTNAFRGPWLAIDDDPAVGRLKRRCIVNGDVGLTPAHVATAVATLREPPARKIPR